MDIKSNPVQEVVSIPAPLLQYIPMIAIDKDLQAASTSKENMGLFYLDGQLYATNPGFSEGMVIIGDENMDEVNVENMTDVDENSLVHCNDKEGVHLDIEIQKTGTEMDLVKNEEVHVISETAAEHCKTNKNQVVLNTVDGNQIVSLVPSDSNPNELVLYVVEEANAKDAELNIYEFNDGEEIPNNDQLQMDEDKKLLRITNRKKSQTTTPIHMCTYCNYTNPKRYLLSRHMKSHSDERPHKCSICERAFKTVISLQNHVNTHTGIRPHRCKFCSSCFTTSGELVRHVRYKHTKEKPHKCNLCDYASVELSKLKRHLRGHNGERPYQCPHCTYASVDSFRLKRHLRVHTGEKPYECSVCFQCFTQSNSLKAHMTLHTGTKPVFACEICPTTCGRKTDLRLHVQKLHMSAEPIKCRKCGKCFPDRYGFKQHHKTHKDEKCFKCELCEYATPNLRHLEAHGYVHSEKKPFKCSTCSQTFRRKQLLKRHVDLHHNIDYIAPVPKEKRHRCVHCNKLFRHKGNLARHIDVHKDMKSTNHIKSVIVPANHKLDDIPKSDVTVQNEDGNTYFLYEVVHMQDEDGNNVLLSDDVTSPMLNCHDTEPLLDDSSTEKKIKRDVSTDSCFEFEDNSDSIDIFYED